VAGESLRDSVALTLLTLTNVTPTCHWRTSTTSRTRTRTCDAYLAVCRVHDLPCAVVATLLTVSRPDMNTVPLSWL
jgi:hypothetical protein